MQFIFRSIQFRLVSLSVILSGATLVLLSTFLFEGIQDTQNAAFDTALYNHAVDIANGLDVNVLGNLMVRRDALVDDHKIFPFPLGQSIVQIRTLDGKIIMSSVRLNLIELPLTEETALDAEKHGSRLDNIRIANVRYRLINYVTHRPSLPSLVLQVAVPLTMIESERQQILYLLWIFIPFVLATSSLVGVFTVRRALKPVRRIISTTQAIEPHELSARVPVPRESEMKDLALTLNELLARLQKAFASQEQFIADASHQLKTPLAIIRGEIDVFHQAQAKTPEETTQLTLSILQETTQLAKLVDDLLLLARFDGGALTPQFSRVRIDEVVLETIAQLKKLANQENVDISFNLLDGADRAEDLEVSGDADLLRALFFNLIENSIKYSPKPGQTSVEISSQGSMIRVDVRDRGVGICREDLKRIFDRFYRGDKTQHQVAGVGLGLSIASRIARFHGGELTVESELGQGTAFSLRIKKF